MISNDYRELNRQQHEADPKYGTSGWKSAGNVLHLTQQLGCRTVLDYGCGKGALKQTLPPALSVREYDPAIPGKDGRPLPADLVVCADVMEHVEPEHVTEVIEHIGTLAMRAAYFVISLADGKRTLLDGSLCHRTVKPAAWWVCELEAIGGVEVLEPTRASRNELVCLVRPY